MNKYADTLLRLSGTAEEKTWLEERLEMLSVKEGIILAAAVERSPPANMADAVNCLLTLKEYDVYPAGSYEELGEFCLWEKCVPQDQQPFFDKYALGQWYEDEHPGLFIGCWYVAYPDREFPMPYNGCVLPLDIERMDWSVRLKMASEAVPEGVWVKLPDYKETCYGTPDEVLCALEALRVKELDDCTLLEARCVLPGIRDVASQYGNLPDLIYDGQEFGFVLGMCGQENRPSLEKFLTVLEYADCRSMRGAINLFDTLDCYELIDADDYIDSITQELNKEAWARHGEQIKGCFDYAGYAEAMAKRQGYQMTDDEHYYIRKRDSPELEQQPPGMTMQ